MLQPKPVVGLPKRTEPELKGPDVSLGAGLAASFRQENTLVSAYHGIGNYLDRRETRLSTMEDGSLEWQQPDPDYDPFSDIENTHYAKYSRSFIGSHNPQETRLIKTKIDREIEDRKTMQAMGGMGIATALLAGVVDPINLVPVGGQIYRGVSTGSTVARMAGSTAAAAGAGAALAEVGLHASQDTRTAKESADAVLFSMMLGGVLGGAVGGVIGKQGSKPLSERLRGSTAYNLSLIHI